MEKIMDVAEIMRNELDKLKQHIKEEEKSLNNHKKKIAKMRQSYKEKERACNKWLSSTKPETPRQPRKKNEAKNNPPTLPPL